jgi:hypothetical protein
MSVRKPKKFVRKQNSEAVEDAANVSALTYNRYAGAFKNLEVGPMLEPLDNGSGGFTTNATAAKGVRKGSTIAVYNNGGTLQSLTLGTSIAVAALAAGVADANGQVGYPCRPNDWTYLNSGEFGFLIANSANLMVFVIRDDTNVEVQG